MVTIQGLLLAGKLGTNAGCGFARCGYSRCGDLFKLGGVYQMVKGKNGKINIVKRYYRPTDPQTEAQLERRTLFASAVAEWQSLTPEEKARYNLKARSRRLSGYNFFLSGHLKNG